jgi:glycerophosphoryl diester phosphodiesterase
MSTFQCFGHRGAAGYAPENTLLSVEKGIELGADWIHVDVRAAGEKCAVIRDERFETTTNGQGLVNQKSWDYIRSLDAGQGEKVPALAEVIDCVNGRAGINIEIKSHDTVSFVVSEIHRAVFRGGWMYNMFLVSSFNYLELQLIKCYDPHIDIGVMQAGSPLEYGKIAEELGAYSLHVCKSDIMPDQVDDAHRRGLKVFAYTVNTEEDLSYMYAMGVDGVFSDYPEKVVRWRSAHRAGLYAVT